MAHHAEKVADPCIILWCKAAIKREREKHYPNNQKYCECDFNGNVYTLGKGHDVSFAQVHNTRGSSHLTFWNA